VARHLHGRSVVVIELKIDNRDADEPKTCLINGDRQGDGIECAAIVVDWNPGKPEGWRKLEIEIRRLLRAAPDAAAFKDKPLKALVEKDDDGWWYCTNVWSGNEVLAPPFRKSADLALRLRRLQP